MLQKSKPELVEMFRQADSNEDVDALLELVEGTAVAAKRYEEIREFFSSAHARLYAAASTCCVDIEKASA
jgi:hypothetical protein